MKLENKTVESICAVLAHDLGTSHIVMQTANDNWFVSINDHTISIPDYVDHASTLINHVEVQYNRYANNRKCTNYKSTLEREFRDRSAINPCIDNLSDELRIRFQVGTLMFTYTHSPITKLVEDNIPPCIVARDALDWLVEQFEEYIRK